MMSIRAALAAGLLAVFLMAALTWTLAAATPPVAPAVQNDQNALRINEFMADNQFTLEDPNEPGEHPDWIELYNPTASPVSLDGLFLSDDPNRPTRHAISTGLTIPAGGFMLFYADNDPEQGAQHLSFALARAGGFISLFSSATDAVIDSYLYAAQSTDISEGRQSDGGGNLGLFLESDTWAHQ